MMEPIILVTGSTDGIGKATARELASRGVEVIVHGRDPEKGRRVLEELKKITGNTRLSLHIADLSEQKQVRRLAGEISTGYGRLDVLINNAGTFEKTRKLTPDGVEMTFAVNFLAPFLLTQLLLPLLQKSVPSRVVTVASIAHHDVHRIDWDNLQGERQYDSFEAYSLSKFADISFTYSLARKMSGGGVTANCLHPGVINTKMLREGFPGYPGRPPEEGARTPVYLALSPEVATISGRYFEDQRPARSSPLTGDRKVQERLWKAAKKITGFPE